MEINAQLRLNENYATESEIASGWVEIENTIKFPVKVRRYTDKTNGKEKMFVSYPQRKSGDGYEDIVHPQDATVRAEIQEKVLRQLQKDVTKGLDALPVTDVSISLLEKERNAGTVKIKAIASVKICGLWINGIMVKESQKGIFVQMPQYQSKDGEYKDTVYGTSILAQQEIKEKVEYAYEKEIERIRQQEDKMMPERNPVNIGDVEEVPGKKMRSTFQKSPKLQPKM